MVVPDGVDDPRRPSGGNRYDRCVRRELEQLGRPVAVHAVAGGWPRPDATALAGLAAAIGAIPDGCAVLVDGLVGSAAADVLVPAAARLRLAVLVHMPLGGNGAAAGVLRGEAAVLAAAHAVIVPSRWARSLLGDLYGLPGDRVQVAEPGVEAAALAPGTAAGGELVCVAALTAAKGHDLLVDALEVVAGLDWRCRLVGSLDRDPAFADAIRGRIAAAGLDGRVQLTGVCSDAQLDRIYRDSDLLVVASRGETYGMVVTEALARGLPVAAAAVGGVPEALGGHEGERPGLLVEPNDSGALAAALRAWLTDAGLRERLRTFARERPASLPAWSQTAAAIAAATA